MLYIYFMSRAAGCANSSADSAGNNAVAVVQRAPQVTVKGAGRRASRVLAAALSAIALSDDAAGPQSFLCLVGMLRAGCFGLRVVRADSATRSREFTCKESTSTRMRRSTCR